MNARARIIDADHLSLRINKVIDIANLLGSEAFIEGEIPEDFENFIDSTQYKRHTSVEALSSILPSDGCDAEPEDIHERLYNHKMFGVLLNVGTPVRKHFDEGSWRFSYGHTYSGWVYGNTYDEAWEQAKHWAKERHAADLSKFMEGGAA